ncbi:NAD(P)H dehydrogenase (quinone) [Pararobbsia alpina]
MGVGVSEVASKPRVLITGATGKVGGAVVRHLANNPAVEVIAGARTPEKAAHLGVAVRELDFDQPSTLESALNGIDRVFMLTGYTVDMFRQSKSFVNAARRAGVQHIVHLGACGDDDTEVAHWGWQQFVERYIEWAGFDFTHLRPDIFMQNVLGYGGARAAGDGVIRHYVGDAAISWVDTDDVAEVAANILVNPQPHLGKVYRLASDVRTYHQVAQALTDVLKQPFVYEARPAEEFMEKVRAAGADIAYMQSAYENYAAYSAGKTPEPGAEFGVLSQLLGRPGATWEAFAAAHAGELKY